MDNNKNRIAGNSNTHRSSARPFASVSSLQTEQSKKTGAYDHQPENHTAPSSHASRVKSHTSDKHRDSSPDSKSKSNNGKVLYHSKAASKRRYASSGKVSLLCLIIIVLIGTVAIALYFITSVKTIRILGCNSFSEEYVINLSGLYTGKNLYSYDLKEAEASIELNPYIEVISAERQFPSTLCLKISERVEHAAIVGVNDHYCILDKTGFILYIGHRESTEGLILIEGLGTSGFTVGTTVDIDKSKLRTYALVELLSATYERSGEILCIDLSNTSNIKIKTANGFTVMLGDSLNLEEKISRMFTALDEWSISHPEGGILYINESGMTDYSKGTPKPTVAPMDTPSPDPNATSTPEPTSGA